MTDDEINAGLFGHKAEAAPQVTAPAAATTARAPVTTSRATNTSKIVKDDFQASMPDVNALAQQAATGQATLVENVEPPKAKPAIESLHEAYPWLFPALAGLGTLAAAKTASGFFTGNKEEKATPSSISDRMIRKEPTLDNERFGGLTPPKAVQLQESAPQFAGPATTPAESSAIKDPAEVMQTPEQKRKAKLAQATASIDGRIPQAPVERPAMQGTAAPSPISIEQEIGVNPQPKSYPEGMTATTPVGNEPKDMNLVRRSEYNKSENEINKAKAEKLAEQGAVEPKKPAKSKAIPAFKSAADIPEGTVFRPDVGNLDRSLVNILGPEGRLYAKDVLNEGKMFGEYKGKDYNKKIQDIVGAYGEKLKEITPSIDLTTREGRVAAGAPHTQNFGSALGRAAKVGGVLGTLMTVAQSANAREAARNVGESLLPLALTPSSLANAELTPEILAAQERQMKEMQKLGSPYRSVPPPKR